MEIKFNKVLVRHLSSRMIKLGRVLFVCILIVILMIVSILDHSIWKPVAKPLTQLVIVLDAGHGGPDGGASSKDGLLEKDLTLKVVLKLKELLQQAGAEVVLTREEDQDLSKKGHSLRKRKQKDLMNRVQLVNSAGADVLLSIHLNSIPSEKWSGAQTFYDKHKNENKILAETIQTEIKKGLENTDRDAKKINHVYLLKNVNITAALIEIGFLSNNEEKELLKQDVYQRKVAESIYRGLIRYFEPSTGL